MHTSIDLMMYLHTNERFRARKVGEPPSAFCIYMMTHLSFHVQNCALMHEVTLMCVCMMLRAFPQLQVHGSCMGVVRVAWEGEEWGGVGCQG